MPTSYTDQFYVMDPFAPPAAGTPLAVSSFVLVDQNNDGDVDRFNNDRVDGSDVRESYPGDTVTVNVPGVGNVTYTGITFYLADGRQVFTPTDGQVLQDGTFVSSTFVSTQGPLDVGDLGPPCFTAGTLIATPEGDRPVEEIAAGDLVLTLDNGPRPVRWTGTRRLGPRALARTPRLRPIRISAGALGAGRPLRDLVVSPQHRVLVRSRIAGRIFDAPEVLVAAKQLLGVEGIAIDTGLPSVTYVHLLFDRHEIVMSNGAATESLFTGPVALDGVGRAAREEILTLFPELATGGPPEGARPIAPGRKARRLAMRHALNRKPLVEGSP